MHLLIVLVIIFALCYTSNILGLIDCFFLAKCGA